jgi:hypothetical protein
MIGESRAMLSGKTIAEDHVKNMYALPAGWILVLLFAACPTIQAEQRDPFVLVKDGRQVASVVCAEKHPSVQAAVADLVEYAERISGARLDIKQQAADTPGPTLHIGRTDLCREHEGMFDEVRVDGFVVLRVGEDMVISGKIPEGTANGITTVLQDDFGVRWYYESPLWHVVPRRATLTIASNPDAGSQAEVCNPTFVGRHRYRGFESQEFARRMRLTMPSVDLPYRGAGHHLSSVVNPERFGDHPEYFAYWDGKRHVERGVHPCFTHPDMPEIFVNEIRKGNGNFGVNDNLTACRCERCLEVDGDSKPYMGMVNISESYFQLISKVAEKARRIAPNLRIGVFAYQLTNAPPESVEHVGDNVDVVLCQDTAQYFDEERKRIDQEMSAEWVTKCGHIRFYDYIGLSCWTPRYFPSILADQIKHIADIGVAGYGTHAKTMIDSSMPMYYLLGRLLWDSSLDEDALIDTMITDLYGKAAEPMAAFYDHWEDRWEAQNEAHWLFGIDNFRGEMSIYQWHDFVRGRQLLDEAAKLASDDIVRKRIAYIRDRYEFTLASADAFYTSMKAIQWKPTGDENEAIALSDSVVRAWLKWEEVFLESSHLSGIPLGGGLGREGRVRVWSLKQQMRDGVMAPLVRWVVANEGKLPPERLRRVEHVFAGVGMVNRQKVEQRITRQVQAEPYPSRVEPLLVADVPRTYADPELDAALDDWDDAGPLDAASWVFLDWKKEVKVGRYDDPVARHRRVMDVPPFRDELWVSAQSKWNEHKLYLRVRVKDETHFQHHAGSDMWDEDSLRIVLTPERDNFLYDVHSWTYIWGGLRGCELDIGLALTDNEPVLHVNAHADAVDQSDVKSGVDFAVRRHHPYTIYEAAIDWDLIPGFEPLPEKSVGIWLVVHDAEADDRQSAEYGSGVNRVNRPTGFSAIRLVK